MRRRLRCQHGFTLIELLVVALIIGILAVIALPVFLGQGKRAMDAAAKADAGNAQILMESCAVEDGGDYTRCTEARLTARGGHLPWGPHPGEVAVTSADSTGYTITATSKSKDGSTPRSFTIARSSAGIARTDVGDGAW